MEQANTNQRAEQAATGTHLPIIGKNQTQFESPLHTEVPKSLKKTIIEWRKAASENPLEALGKCDSAFKLAISMADKLFLKTKRDCLEEKRFIGKAVQSEELAERNLTLDKRIRIAFDERISSRKAYAKALMAAASVSEKETGENYSRRAVKIRQEAESLMEIDHPQDF